MPIYAYRCADCGHTKDVLQKLSDAPLTDCPSCGSAAFAKQLTAAGFQLKGSGWYVTDFKGGGGAKPAAKPADGGGGASAGEGAASGGSGGDAKPAATGEAASAVAGCGTSCACH